MSWVLLQGKPNPLSMRALVLLPKGIRRDDVHAHHEDVARLVPLTLPARRLVLDMRILLVSYSFGPCSRSCPLRGAAC